MEYIDEAYRSEKLAAGRTLILHLSFAVFLALGGLLLEQVIGYHAYMSYIAWLILAMSYYRILVKDTFFFVLLFMLLNGFWGPSASLMLIESGTYMSEIQEYGYPIGAGMKLTFYVLLFILGAYLTFYFLFGRRIYDGVPEIVFRNNSLLLIGFYSVLGGILLTMNIIVAIYGSPLSLGIDRVLYWKKIAPPITEYLHNTLPQLSCISGLIYTQNIKKRWKRVILVLFFITLVTEVLQGEKLSKLLMTTYFFWLSTLLNKFRYKNLKITLKVATGAIFVLLLMITSVLINYTLLKGSSVLAWMSFVNRLSLQGQVWWAVDRHVGVGPKDFEFFFHQIFGLGNVPDYDVGLLYLMHLISPIEAILYYEGGAVYTCGYPSILVLGTGYVLGVPALMLCGAFMSLVIFLLSEYLRRKDIVPILFALKLFFACYIAFIMGGLHLFVTPKFYLFLLGSIVLYYVRIKGTNTVEISRQ